MFSLAANKSENSWIFDHLQYEAPTTYLIFSNVFVIKIYNSYSIYSLKFGLFWLFIKVMFHFKLLINSSVTKYDHSKHTVQTCKKSFVLMTSCVAPLFLPSSRSLWTTLRSAWPGWVRRWRPKYSASSRDCENAHALTVTPTGQRYRRTSPRSARTRPVSRRSAVASKA